MRINPTVTPALFRSVTPGLFRGEAFLGSRPLPTQGSLAPEQVRGDYGGVRCVAERTRASALDVLRQHRQAVLADFGEAAADFDALRRGAFGAVDLHRAVADGRHHR